MKEYTLRQLCEICGVTRRAVQGYEAHGLISPCGKTKRCYLLYDENAVHTVRKIKDLQNFGFSLTEIVCYAADSHSRAAMLKEKLIRLRDSKSKTESYIRLLEQWLANELSLVGI